MGFALMSLGAFINILASFLDPWSVRFFIVIISLLILYVGEDTVEKERERRRNRIRQPDFE